MDSLHIIRSSDHPIAILTIHGIVGTPKHFDFMLPAIPQEWSVYSLLLPGHGGTVADFARFSCEDWFHAVLDAVETLSARHRHIILMGHSLGTLLSAKLSIAHPDSIAALIAFAMPFSIRIKPGMLIRCMKVLFDRVDENDVWTAASRDSYSIERDTRLWRYISWIPRYRELFSLSYQTCREAHRIPVPVYAIYSAKDELVSSRSLRYLQRVPQYHLLMLEESGHYYYPDPDKTCILCHLTAILKDIATSLGE